MCGWVRMFKTSAVNHRFHQVGELLMDVAISWNPLIRHIENAIFHSVSQLSLLSKTLMISFGRIGGLLLGRSTIGENGKQR